MENAEVALLKTGASVQTERIAYAYSPKAEDGGVRPEAYLVNDTVTYNNREKQHIHLSFTNMEPKEQGEMNDVVSNMEMPEILNQGDRLREQMTAVQYAELMESTDQYLPDVRGEFCQGKMCIRDSIRSFGHAGFGLFVSITKWRGILFI